MRVHCSDSIGSQVRIEIRCRCRSVAASVWQAERTACHTSVHKRKSRELREEDRLMRGSPVWQRRINGMSDMVYAVYAVQTHRCDVRKLLRRIPPCLPVCISVSANGIMHKHLHSVLMLRWDSANLLCFVGFWLGVTLPIVMRVHIGLGGGRSRRCCVRWTQHPA